MSRKAMIFDFMFTSIIRGILSCMLAFMGIGLDYLGKVPMPLGSIFTIFIMSLYVYSFIDEAILTFRECKKYRISC